VPLGEGTQKVGQDRVGAHGGGVEQVGPLGTVRVVRRQLGRGPPPRLAEAAGRGDTFVGEQRGERGGRTAHQETGVGRQTAYGGLRVGGSQRRVEDVAADRAGGPGPVRPALGGARDRREKLREASLLRGALAGGRRGVAAEIDGLGIVRGQQPGVAGLHGGVQLGERQQGLQQIGDEARRVRRRQIRGACSGPVRVGYEQQQRPLVPAPIRSSRRAGDRVP
jgi:hypothetical protein